MLKKFIRSRKLDQQLSEYRPRLHRLAHSWCGDKMLADDLVQETLNKSIIKQHQLKDFSRMEAWLFRIMHNCWMEYIRAKKPALDIDDISLLDNETPETQLSKQQVIFRIRQAIAKLPLTQRQVITLIDLEACSYAEVSEILDIPQGTVMSRLSRAREALKKSLINVKSIQVPQQHLRSVK